MCDYTFIARAALVLSFCNLFIFLHFSFMFEVVNLTAVCDCTQWHNPIIFRSITPQSH